MKTTLINVSNRLPVTVTDSSITKSSGGLVAALEGLATDQYDLKWLGWPGGDIAPDRQPEIERVLQNDYGSTPIFLTADETEGHYESFSNPSICPLLHYMPSKFAYEPAWWDAYQDVNRRFAEKVKGIAHDGDLVWVHDYQL